MSKDLYQVLAVCLLLVAIGQHIVFNIAIDALVEKLSQIEKMAERNNGWVLIETDK